MSALPSRVEFAITGTRTAPKRQGLARQIRERTNELEEQLSEAIRISLDSDHKHQFAAIQWLTDRAYGRVPEIAAFAELDQAEASAAIQGLNSAQLETLAHALEVARAGQSTGSQAPEPSDLSLRVASGIVAVST